MNRQNYRWPRYWFYRDRDKPWLDTSFLFSFSHDQTYSPQDRGLFELEDLLDEPCLILLGEPGMGKTHILENAKTVLNNTPNERYCFFDLGEFKSVSELGQEVFTNNPDFVAWQNGDFKLHLFLDGLDEAIVQIKSATHQIQKHIANNKAHLYRLYFRITCRVADWPEEFENELKQVWKEDNELKQAREGDSVHAFVLASLQQADINVAATQNNLDAVRFWHEIIEKNAQAFASRPITLQFLLREFSQRNALPDSRRELYEQGCRELCREVNFAHEQITKSQPEERFAIAARIAALSIFTGHTGVSSEYHFADNNSLTIQNCAGGKEQVNNLTFNVYERSVIETLATALFQGGLTRQWAHKTYAEFLAAWYAVKNLSLPQIRSLIFNPNNKLIPQLEETAAWIASFSEDVFSDILKIDPFVLLRSDVATGDNKARSKLTVSLLETYQQAPHLSYSRAQLATLKCPELANILNTYLGNKNFHDNVQELILDIIKECQVTELLDSVIAIALNTEQPLYLRSQAARCVLNIGSQQHKSQLRPIALMPLESRNHGDLKRHSILANWPHSLSAQELFQNFTAVTSDDDSLIDHYAAENWAEIIIPKLHPEDLPYALEWATHLEKAYNLVSVFADLLDAILFLGWQHLDQPDVLAAYSQATIALWQRHDELLTSRGRRVAGDSNINRLTREIILADENKRLNFLKYLISAAAPYNQNVIYHFESDALVSHTDVPWLINQFNQRSDKQEKRLIATLIRRQVAIGIPEQFQYIYNIGQQNAELWQALDYRLYFELDSDEANQAKQRYLQDVEHQSYKEELEAKRNRPLSGPSPLARVRDNLAKFYTGDIDAWWLMSYWMMFNPAGRYDNIHELEPNCFSLPVWKQLHEAEKVQIVESAPHYINNFRPNANSCDKWWEQPGWIFWPIVAGCRAFLLLINYNQIDKISGNTWRKWAPALTYYVYRSLPFTREGDARNQNKAFLNLVQQFAPEESTETILWIAERENQEGHPFLASRIDKLWNVQLAEAMLLKISAGELSTPHAFSILLGIANYNFSLIRPLLENWLPVPAPTKKESREKAAFACRLLLEHAPGSGWSLIWPAIQQDRAFGDQVMRLIGRSEGLNRTLATELTESELADFYLWLYQQYPPENDPNRIGFQKITPEHTLADIRDSTLRQLVNKGTQQGVEQLERLQNILNSDLSHDLYQAELIMRQNTWQPIEPQALRTLFENQQNRWIQDENQLLEAIEESLNDLNEILQLGYSGGLPASIDLWNEYPHGRAKDIKLTPKDEERLSDYVARFLKRELEEKKVFIGRETQISRGNFTDILVQSNPETEENILSRPVTIVIEVKGCWNREIEGSLSHQLAERYLKDHGLRHGIYLVGHFFCKRWNRENDENRWRASSRMNKTELMSFLETQSRELSKTNLHIRPFILDVRYK